MIKILVADDQAMIRTLLTGVCRTESDMTVVGEAETGELAIELVHENQPDVLVVDIKLPGISGLEVTRRLARQLPELRIIVLTALDERGFAVRALEAGAHGFLTKQAVVPELVDTIRHVHAGERYVDSVLAQRIALNCILQEQSPIERLSDREVEVLMLMVRGQTAAEISQTLSVSSKTVDHYRRSLRHKLDATTDVQLGAVATRHGLDPMVEGFGRLH